MPDYPYVYASPAPRPVEPGGTRIRVFRRRPRKGEEGAEEERREAEERLARWREALTRAVDELNRAMEEAGLPHRVRLVEDSEGFLLHVSTGAEGAQPPLEAEELLDPADLPRWLARLRARLGLLVDETA